MENRSMSLASILNAAVLRSGAYGNPYLSGGYLMGSSLLGLLVIIGAFLCNRSQLRLFRRSCIMSFTCQENRLMGVQLIYSCLLTLLTMSALNLIVTLILGTALVESTCFNPIDCIQAENTWFLSRWFGVIIHLVNASLSIYNLRQPLSVTRVRITYALVSVVIIIMVPLYLTVTNVSELTLAAFMFLFALSVIITSIAPTSSLSTDTLKKLIMVVAMGNFLVVYVPTFILFCLRYTAVDYYDFSYYYNIYVNVLVFTNLHLIFDGLQCALFLKLPSGEEQQQQQQWQPQQQQKLGFQNAGFTSSTNVYQ